MYQINKCVYRKTILTREKLKPRKANFISVLNFPLLTTRIKNEITEKEKRKGEQL